jgi:predicted Kef-type K+ transport protein
MGSNAGRTGGWPFRRRKEAVDTGAGEIGVGWMLFRRSEVVVALVLDFAAW